MNVKSRRTHRDVCTWLLLAGFSPGAPSIDLPRREIFLPAYSSQEKSSGTAQERSWPLPQRSRKRSQDQQVAFGSVCRLTGFSQFEIKGAQKFNSTASRGQGKGSCFHKFTVFSKRLQCTEIQPWPKVLMS